MIFTHGKSPWSGRYSTWGQRAEICTLARLVLWWSFHVSKTNPSSTWSCDANLGVSTTVLLSLRFILPFSVGIYDYGWLTDLPNQCVAHSMMCPGCCSLKPPQTNRYEGILWNPYVCFPLFLAFMQHICVCFGSPNWKEALRAPPGPSVCHTTTA